MYLAYWGLQEKPFENTPDPRFFYPSPKHEEALMRMFYVVNERKAAGMLTGEVGSGKTLLSRALIHRLTKESDRFQIALIVNPAISPSELLQEVIAQLSGATPLAEGKGGLLRRLNDLLYQAYTSQRHTVIVVDEAQVINDPQVFEELRLLLNFQFDNRFLLTLIVIGQPELNERIMGIPQFEQRITTKYHLNYLDRAETHQYIRHRCGIAGGQDSLFPDESCDLVYEGSQGVPRKINIICDLALVIGVGEKVTQVSPEIVREVVKDRFNREFLAKKDAAS